MGGAGGVSGSAGQNGTPDPTPAPSQISIAVGNGPVGVAFNPAGSLLYVANNGTGATTVSVIDTTSNTVTATVTVGSRPESVVVNPVLIGGVRYAYATNAVSGSVSVINTATNLSVATITVGSIPQGLAISPDGTRVYVANANSATVSVIDTALAITSPGTAVLANPIVGFGPNDVAVNPVLIGGVRYAYVANSVDGTVSVLNTNTYAQSPISVGTPASGQNPGSNTAVLTVTPDGSRVYVTNANDDNVKVIRTSDNTVIGTIAVGDNPRGIAVNPAGTLVYVANSSSTTISVIDSTGGPGTVVATLTAGQFPRELAVNPAGTFLYVANNGDNTVWAIPL